MTQQSAPYGTNPNAERRSDDGGLADQIAEGAKTAARKARDVGGQALERTENWMKPLGLSIKERPMTCLAVVGGVAFAAGAVWMLRTSRQRPRTDELLAQMSDTLRRSRWW
jgi:hypothetical protein